MGQRLIMNIYEHEYDDEPILNVYYHWSAYTRAAYEEALNFINAYRTIRYTGNMLIDCLRALEYVGARVTEEERKVLFEDLNFEAMADNVNRNLGLIAYTQKGKDQNSDYGEGVLNIYMNEHRIINYCSYIIDKQELIDIGVNIEEIPLIEKNLEDTTFDDIEEVLQILTNLTRSGFYIYKNSDNEYINLIE